MKTPNIHTIDLNFLGKQGAIASYLIPWEERAILVESGPSSTLSELKAGLMRYGYSIEDVSDVFVTHIHLDHAGAAGYLAQEGARIYAHPLGGPHLVNPVKLLESARRIYGESMDQLWGKVVRVPEDQLCVLEDGETISLGPHTIQAISTPGHAPHHHAYLYEGVCFSGDVGGVRLPGKPNLTLPMPPPDIRLDLWKASVARLREVPMYAIAPTHFGIYTETDWQLDQIAIFLQEVDGWLTDYMSIHSDLDQIPEGYIEWFAATAADHGLEAAHHELVEIINPAIMSGLGLRRYWKKFRVEDESIE